MEGRRWALGRGRSHFCGGPMNCGDFIELFRLFKICSNFHKTKTRCCYILYIHTLNIIHSSSKTKTHLHIYSRNQDIPARNTINKPSPTKRLSSPLSTQHSSVKPSSTPSPYHKRTPEAPQPASQSSTHPTHRYSSYYPTPSNICLDFASSPSLALVPRI